MQQIKSKSGKFVSVILSFRTFCHTRSEDSEMKSLKGLKKASGTAFENHYPSIEIYKLKNTMVMTLVKNNFRPVNFNSVFNELLNEFPAFADKAGINFPPVNIAETADAYHVELNAPGRNKEDFKINAEKGLLTISYEKKEETKSEDVKTIRKEFGIQGFKRSFSLDDKVDATNIQAKYENGLLKLLLPKKTEVKEAATQITIQ